MFLEDYYDSQRIPLWRENYLKYKHFLNPGTFVVVKGKFELNYRKEPDFSVRSIELLHNLKESKASMIKLKFTTKSLNQELISELNDLFKENSGECAVHFTVYDSLEEVEVRMPSKSVKIDLNNKLFDKLKSLDLEFEIK
jgi:DNA polymerase-3 subunit alpha